MTITAAAPPTGAAFLLTPAGSQPIFTPERMTSDQRLMRDTAHAFMATDVLPHVAETEALQEGAMRSRLLRAGELGLLMADIPERFGGAEAGLLVSTILADALSAEGSFGVAWGAQTTIGSLPVVFYGTEDQQARYLPGLATGDLVASYALTEPAAGSDAMSIRTRAVRSPDGDGYLLSGQKQWISNAGFADLFIVFAKVDDTRFTAFLVERTSPGLSFGAEEKKMGIKGSSTRAVYFDQVYVPAANVLGEIGRGHKIAFNALNVGRLKLGAAAAGTARHVLSIVVPYAQQRTTFGKPIIDYGLIKEKIAGMFVETYALESLVYRTGALLDEAVRDAGGPAGLEEFAIECALAKVLGSEANSRVIDEGLQIFGGYGFMQEYPLEKAYRDVRITRIFEGTNEINRLYAAGTLFKRAMGGQLPLLEAFPTAEVALTKSAPAIPDTEGLSVEVALLERLKQATLYGVVVAATVFMTDMEEQQEFLARVADLLIGIYALDSALSRAVQAPADAPTDAPLHTLAARYLVWRTLPGLRRTLDEVLEAAFTGDELTMALGRVRAHIGDYYLNGFVTGRHLADAAVAANGYPFNR